MTSASGRTAMRGKAITPLRRRLLDTCSRRSSLARSRINLGHENRAEWSALGSTCCSSAFRKSAIMRVAGSIYMVWLALKIALAKPIGEVEAGGRPIGFLAAAGFQWVNPKACVMALSALAAYAGVVDGYTSSVLFIAALCALIAIPCSGVWLLFGASLSRSLKDPRVTRPFNWTMAALLVASIAPTLFEWGLGEGAVSAELDDHHFRRPEDAHWRERRSQSARNDHPPLAQGVFAINVFS
jgi:hypothetical protein